jgi:hypothetical protein
MLYAVGGSGRRREKERARVSDNGAGKKDQIEDLCRGNVYALSARHPNDTGNRGVRT